MEVDSHHMSNYGFKQKLQSIDTMNVNVPSKRYFFGFGILFRILMNDYQKSTEKPPYARRVVAINEDESKSNFDHAREYSDVDSYVSHGTDGRIASSVESSTLMIKDEKDALKPEMDFMLATDGMSSAKNQDDKKFRLVFKNPKASKTKFDQRYNS